MKTVLLIKKNTARALKFFLFIGLSYLLSSCTDSDLDAIESHHDFFSAFSFEDGNAGWAGGFSNFPEEDMESFSLEAALDVLPNHFQQGYTNKAMRLTGSSKNGELFMFLKVQIEDLAPNVRYELEFSMNTAFDVDTVSNHVGSHAKKIHIKAGALTNEPMATLTSDATDLGFIGYKPNFQKGDSGHDGNDLAYLGSIEVGRTAYQGNVFTVESHTKTISCITDSDGKLWLVVGVESEVPTRVDTYFTDIAVFYDNPLNN